MKPKIWKNYYDIVILPPKEARDYAIKISKKLHEYGSQWILGKKSFLPHISLYHIPVKPEDFKNFIGALSRTVNGFKTVDLTLTKIEYYKYHGSAMIMADKPAWLNRFYQHIIKSTIPYFDWQYDIDTKWRTKQLPKGLRDNIKKFGTPLIGRDFKPHITLTVFKNNQKIAEIIKRLRCQKIDFKINCIFVCQLGEYYTCQRIVKQIRF